MCPAPAGHPRARREEAGFTLVELMMALALLAVGIFATMQVFLGSLAVSGYAQARTRAAALATGEIEAMRAPPYDRIAAYPATPTPPDFVDPRDQQTYQQVGEDGPAVDPNATTETIASLTYTVRRTVVWADLPNMPRAYKRLIVRVSWRDRAGDHEVRQDAAVYPGGLGPYGSSTTTTSTTLEATTVAPPQSLSAVPNVDKPQSQVDLSWAPGSPAPSDAWEVESSFDDGATWVTLTASQPPGITTYSAQGLSSSTSYRFRVRGWSGSAFSSWTEASATTAAAALPSCRRGTTTMSPSVARLNRGKGGLQSSLTVTVNTNGLCSNLEVEYPTDGGPSRYAMSQNGSTFNHTLASRTGSWSTGAKTIRVLSGTTEVDSVALQVNG